MKKKKTEKNTTQQIEKAKVLLEMTGFVNILDGRDIAKSIRGYATSLKRKKNLRESITKSVEDFLSKGGSIKTLPYIEPKER